MDHVTVCFAIVALFSGSVLSQEEQPDEVQRSHCENEQFDFAQPQLMTAPGPRISCLYLKNFTQYIWFSVDVEGDTIKGTLPGLGSFAGEVKPCPSGAGRCMMLSSRSIPAMDGVVQFYDNAQYRQDKSLDSTRLPYIAIQDCRNAEPGPSYIEFRHPFFGTLNADDLNDLKKLYGVEIDRESLSTCLDNRFSSTTP